MTDFVTLDDLRHHIGDDELLQLAGTGSHNSDEGRVLDEGQIATQITYANDLIFGYLINRYPRISTLSAEEVPELLRGLGCDLVRYRLRARSGDRNTVTDEVRQRYEDAIKWLRDAARGHVNVPLAGDAHDGSADASTAGEVRASIPERRAARALQGYA